MNTNQVTNEQKVATEVKTNNQKVTDFFGRYGVYIEKLVDFYLLCSPFIEIIRQNLMNLIDILKPYIVKYKVVEHYELLLGFILLTFGGNFAMTIACYYALQISGWPLLKESYFTIKRNYEKAKEIFENDQDVKNYFDINHDGQVTSEEIREVLKKSLLSGNANDRAALLLNIKSILIAINPNEIVNGLLGIWQVLLTTLATLRSGIAKEIALGVNLGKMFHKNVSAYIKPFILQNLFKKNVNLNSNKSNNNAHQNNIVIDDEKENLKQWVDFFIESACKMIGIALSFLLIRCISAFHSAMKGGSIVAKYIFSFLVQQQLIPPDININNNGESNVLFLFIQYALTAYGFYFQLMSGFAIRWWWLRVLLLPFTFIELVLSYLATR